MNLPRRSPRELPRREAFTRIDLVILILIAWLGAALANPLFTSHKVKLTEPWTDLPGDIITGGPAALRLIWSIRTTSLSDTSIASNLWSDVPREVHGTGVNFTLRHSQLPAISTKSDHGIPPASGCARNHWHDKIQFRIDESPGLQ